MNGYFYLEKFYNPAPGDSGAKAARSPRKTWNFIPCFTRRSLELLPRMATPLT
jgi:hypothetical protein